jgi:CBS domain-containing protein
LALAEATGAMIRPVVKQEFVSTDGTSSFASRTYCPVRGKSIPLEQCRTCDCFQTSHGLRCQPVVEGEKTAGRATSEGAVAVEEGTSAFEVAGLLVTRDLPFMMVVDKVRRVTRVVSRENLTSLLPDSKLSLLVHIAGRRVQDQLRKIRIEETPASDLATLETMPLDEALDYMRLASVTALAVVAIDGSPFGILREREAHRILREVATMPPTAEDERQDILARVAMHP